MTIKRAIFFWLIMALLVSLPLQWLIDPAAENVAAVCIVMASSIGVLLYVGFSDGLKNQPVSTLAILGYCVTTHMGALLVQTAAWTAIRSYLYTPLWTFGVIVFYQWIAVGMHAAYRYFSPEAPRPAGLLRGIFGWLGLYKTPSVSMLWFMGCVGLASLLLSRFEGVLGKIGLAFNFLTWAPFLIPFYLRELGEGYCDRHRNKVMLVVYAGVIAILALAVNARQLMLIGGLTVGMLYWFAGMRSRELLTGKMVRNAILAAIGLAILSAPLSNLATSMAIARTWRGKISPIAMIKTTYGIMKRPELIAAYNSESAAISRYLAYDERYIANPGLARLVSTKFIDNSLHFAASLKSEESLQRLADTSFDFYLEVVPAPLLDAVGIRIDKEFKYSMGDYLAYLSRGLPLGGHKTGSVFAQGQALYGPLFPVLYALICLAMFGVMDLLTIHRTGAAASMSTLAMLQIWAYFNQGLHYEALHSVFYFFVRNFEQTVLVYISVFAMAQIMERGTHALLGVRSLPRWQQS